MSEFEKLFQKAELAFTYADYFVEWINVGTYDLADAITADLAEKRNLRQADRSLRVEFDQDVRNAVDFAWKIYPAALIILIAMLEEYLGDICHEAAYIRDVPFDLDNSEHFTIEQAVSFLKNEIGISIPNPWPVGEKLQGFQKLRDKVVNHTGLGVYSIKIKDELLNEVNDTARQFFEELQGYMEILAGDEG